MLPSIEGAATAGRANCASSGRIDAPLDWGAATTLAAKLSKEESLDAPLIGGSYNFER